MSEAADLALKYGLSPTQAHIFQEMLARGWVSKGWINDLLDNRNPDAVHPKAAAVHISHLRKKLEPWGYRIEAQWGFGRYMLIKDKLAEAMS